MIRKTDQSVAIREIRGPVLKIAVEFLSERMPQMNHCYSWDFFGFRYGKNPMASKI